MHLKSKQQIYDTLSGLHIVPKLLDSFFFHFIASLLSFNQSHLNQSIHPNHLSLPGLIEIPRKTGALVLNSSQGNENNSPFTHHHYLDIDFRLKNNGSKKAHTPNRSSPMTLRLGAYPKRKAVETNCHASGMPSVRTATAYELQLKLSQQHNNKKSILSCSGRMSNVNRLSSNNVVQWISWRHQITLRHFLSLPNQLQIVAQRIK